MSGTLAIFQNAVGCLDEKSPYVGSPAASDSAVSTADPAALNGRIKSEVRHQLLCVLETGDGTDEGGQRKGHLVANAQQPDHL